MTRRLRAGIFIAAAALAHPACAGSFHPYEADDLEHWQPRYARSIEGNFREVMLPRLDREIRELLGDIRIVVPRSHRLDPFAYFAESDARRITLSAQSIRFLDDASVAFAWLNRNGYSPQSIVNYVLMLKHWTSPDHPPPLLPALCVPEDALSNPDVDSLSAKLLATAVVFIVAHELGHIRYSHRGNRAVNSARSRANEAAADRFALDLMARIGDVPGGIVTLMTIMSLYTENRSDYGSDAEFSAALADRTHPLTAHRLSALAEALAASAPAYAASAAGSFAVYQIAEEVRGYAEALGDPDIQHLNAVYGAELQPHDLGPMRHGDLIGRPCDSPQGDARFSGRWQGDLTINGTPFRTQMEIRQSGETVSGDYSIGSGIGRITGSVSGDRLSFRWALSGSAGTGVMTMNNGGISGTWEADNGDSGGRVDVQRGD